MRVFKLYMFREIFVFYPFEGRALSEPNHKESGIGMPQQIQVPSVKVNSEHYDEYIKSGIRNLAANPRLKEKDYSVLILVRDIDEDISQVAVCAFPGVTTPFPYGYYQEYLDRISRLKTFW